MNKVILMGRLTRDPDVRYGGANNTAVARYTLAVNRKFKRDGEQDVDFINCVAFGKAGEFAEFLDARLYVVARHLFAGRYFVQTYHPFYALVAFDSLLRYFEAELFLRLHDGNPKVALQKDFAFRAQYLLHCVRRVSVCQYIRYHKLCNHGRFSRHLKKKV